MSFPNTYQGHVLQIKAECHSGYQGVLGILFPTELHPEAPGAQQDSMELSYTLRPHWSIQRADVFMQQSCHSHAQHRVPLIPFVEGWSLIQFPL